MRVFNRSHPLSALVTFFSLAVMGCSLVGPHDTALKDETVRVLIQGSYEHPDPILEKVQELEREGLLKNIVIRESFPVQIEVTGPKNVIEMIQAIPKKESPHFR